MSLAILRVMLLGLLRDPGALLMSFLVPPLFFVIFASMFAGASGAEFRLRIALADELGSDESRRLLEALAADPSLEQVGGDALSPVTVREMVRRGSADVGLIVRRDAEPLGSLGGFGRAPLLVIGDPARAVAVPVLQGQVQRAYFLALPDVALGGVVGLIEDQFIELSEAQRDDLERGLDRLREGAARGAAAGQGAGLGLDAMIEREDVLGRGAGLNQVAYYAGAVTVLFLLFAAVHGAISLMDERETGIVDRLLVGPGGIDVLVDGKFLFLLLQGTVQATIIFAFAWLAYGVDLPGHWPAWLATTVAAAAASAAIGLVLVTACRTRQQAQTLSNVVVLVISALGGSMVPRFLMPDLLRDLGWLTPNTWALEAYTSIFWRGDPASALLLPWLLLGLTAVAGLMLARRLARRMAHP